MRNFLLVLVFCGATYGFYVYFSQPRPGPVVPVAKDTRIDASGGEFFFKEVVLPVSLFRQNDPRWGKLPLAAGQQGDTLGSAGCALTSLAMIMLYYGIDTEPVTLNKYLNNHDGYTPEGWLKWEVAAEMAPDKFRFAYEDVATFKLIDANLKKQNPVIVRVRFPSSLTHFVVICGKRGHDYLIRDPGAGSNKGIYPLKELAEKIEALRFYERMEASL